MSTLSIVKKAFVNATIISGKVRARRELLAMTDRQLADFGFSRELLMEGISAWPWRVEQDDVVAARDTAEGMAVKPSLANQTIRQAVRELDSYSDRELAELGITRDGIEDAVRYGRAAIEGTMASDRHAA